jgi:hypothetical protein
MFRADSVVMARILAHIGCAALSALEEDMATRRLAGALGWPAIVSDAVAPEDDAAPASSERGAPAGTDARQAGDRVRRRDG